MKKPILFFLATIVIFTAMYSPVNAVQGGEQTSLTGGYSSGFDFFTGGTPSGGNQTQSGNNFNFTGQGTYVTGVDTSSASTQQNPVFCVSDINNIGDVFKYATCQISNFVMPLLVVLATVIFTGGVIRFFIAKNTTDKEDGKQYMMWGIIALFVMVSVWGIVRIFTNTFFGPTFVVPQIQTYGN
ncbi:MAG: pilin [Candidatus Nomurabacteria bacterium]|nr:pilin [Candidatus Nomurabacteria bacterium]